MGKLYLFVKPITFQLSIKSDIQVSWSPCVIFLDWKTNDKWPKLNLEWASHRSIKTGRRLHTILQTYDMANTKNGYNHFTFSTLYMTTNQLWHWNAIHRRKTGSRFTMYHLYIDLSEVDHTESLDYSPAGASRRRTRSNPSSPPHAM